MKKLLIILLILSFAGFYACKKEQAAKPAPVPEPEPAAEVKLEWTAEPALELIPDAPIKGMANGTPFEGKTVYFEPMFGKWTMVISDGELSSPTGFVSDAQSININLPELPEAGKTIRKDMDYGDGYFQIRKKDDPESTTSWNSDNAFIVKFTKWEICEYNPEGDMFQVAGKASGMVFVSYKGWDTGEFDNSFAAGTFTDAVIRYMGEPELEYSEPAEPETPETPAEPEAPETAEVPADSK